MRRKCRDFLENLLRRFAVRNECSAAALAGPKVVVSRRALVAFFFLLRCLLLVLLLSVAFSKQW